MTLEAIAVRGIGIADQEGLAAVTMARLASELGVTKMALYRYVRSRADVIALMVDASLASGDALAGEGWRPRLEAWTMATHAHFAAHPWALEATVGVRPVGPNEAAWLEAALAALEGLPLAGAEALDLVAALSGQARAIAEQTTSAGGTASERTTASAYAAAAARDPGRYPVLTRTLAAAEHEGLRDQALVFGLARILDGVEALVERRRRA